MEAVPTALLQQPGFTIVLIYKSYTMHWKSWRSAMAILVHNYPLA
jgi:hypothetical protein